MKIVNNIQDLHSQLIDWKRSGYSIGFVPTMGNLHEGHLSLLDIAKQHTDKTVVSIFVNPLQFAPHEDFTCYPRTFYKDCEQLITRGNHLLFAPSHADLFTHAQPPSIVEVAALSNLLCGSFRPHFFRGVTTILCKLFNIVAPDVAVFGEKDFQQLMVVKRMVDDLNFPIKILSGPTIREPDGLAMSSRNQYLSSEERHTASLLYQTLQVAAQRIQAGATDFTATQNAAISELTEAGFRVDYLQICDATTLQPATHSIAAKHLIILTAAWLGKTRLIDNLKWNDGC